MVVYHNAACGQASYLPRQAEEAASKIGAGPWVVKCQVHAGGRGKAGGVKVVNSKEDIRAFAENWLGKRLVTYQTDANGQPVNQILVEAATDIAKELYLGAVVDRSSRRVVFMASTEGGVEIEKVAEETPHLIHKVALDPLTGPMPYQGRELAFKLGLEGKLVQQFTKIFMGLATIFLERDLALIEINPLVITKQGDLICLDGKLGADGNALFRQPDLREMRPDIRLAHNQAEKPDVLQLITGKVLLPVERDVAALHNQVLMIFNVGFDHFPDKLIPMRQIVHLCHSFPTPI